MGEQQPVDGPALARAWFESSPFIGRLGLRLLAMGGDRAEVELPFDGGNATLGDVVHGGAIGSLIDTAAALAAWSEHRGDGARWGTIGLTVNYLAPGRGVPLRAVAEVTRRASTMCFCRVAVSDDAGRPVAEGLVTYRLG